MRRTYTLLFRYTALTIGCLFFVLTKSLSQTDTSTFDRELLALYEQVISSKAVIAPCNMRFNLPVDDVLQQALSYNTVGNWRCCKTMLNHFFEGTVKLSSFEACHLHLALAEYFTSHQSYDSAKVYAVLAKQKATEQNWLNEKAQALLLLSAGSAKRRNFSSAYPWADSALMLAWQTGNERLEGRILFHLALCARRHFTSVAQRAFPYYLMAREKAIAVKDSATLCAVDVYYSVDNFELNKWPEGFPFFKEGLALSLLIKNQSQAYITLVTLGYTLGLKEHQQEALMVFKTALAASLQQQQPYNMQGAYHQLAETYRILKQYDSALVYANLSGRVQGVDSFWANVYELKASIYSDMGATKMASAMYKKSVEWFREDFLYRNQDQLSGYEAKLNTKEKELQVTQQKKRAAQLEWIVGGIAALLIIAAWAFAMQRKAKQKLFLQNNIIQKQSSALEQSLGEKEILLKEIHHRVKNNLSVISSLLELQSNGISNESAKAAIAVGQNRVSSIALIHQRLYQHENLAAIELKGFLQDLFRQVSSVFKKPGTHIEMKTNVPETLLDIDTAVPLGLIMNELLTNTFKYAFVEGKTALIKIDLQQQATGEYMLTYADNGPGIAQEVNMKNTTSLGLRLIHRLSKQLGGTATYRYNNGSTFIVCFKDSLKRNREA